MAAGAATTGAGAATTGAGAGAAAAGAAAVVALRPFLAAEEEAAAEDIFLCRCPRFFLGEINAGNDFCTIRNYKRQFWSPEPRKREFARALWRFLGLIYDVNIV